MLDIGLLSYLRKGEIHSFNSTFKKLIDPVKENAINVDSDNKFYTFDNLKYCFDNIGFTLGLASNMLKEVTDSVKEEITNYKNYEICYNENKDCYVLYEVGTKNKRFRIISNMVTPVEGTSEIILK